MGQDGLPALAAHFSDRAAERERHSHPAQLTLQGPGHRAVIDDSGGRRVQPGAAPALRLVIGDLDRLFPAHPVYTRRMAEHFIILTHRHILSNPHDTPSTQLPTCT